MVFTEPADVIRALVRYRDHYDPRSTSLMSVGAQHSDPTSEPFGAGFLSDLDERSELMRRLNTLGERERLLLALWYGAGLPVTKIARRLRLSRMHCYRLQRRAIADIIAAEGSAGRAAPVPAPAV